jgi:signal transduction histidine kinase
MDFNFVTIVESCYSAIQENPNLLYYSHIPPMIIALVISSFVFLKNRNNIASIYLMFISVVFSFWGLADLMTWTSYDSRMIMFAWSTMYLWEILIFISSLYFVYTFLEESDFPFIFKIVSGIFVVPAILFMPTAFNIRSFEISTCEAMESNFIYYVYVVESFFSLLIVAYLVRKIFEAKKEDRGKIIYLLIGISFFILAFSWVNLIGTVTQDWKITQYGLFGMPIFLGFLAYLIVRYKAFDIKLIGAQALVSALILLIGSQFFFVKTTINFVLTGITFVLAIGFGWMLIRSVKQEMERKEELQKLSDSLAVTNDRLRELDNAKSEFISIASHQLRTPLTAIKGYTSLLLEGSYGKVPPAIQDILDKVYTINNRLVELVENLLNISRIEAGRIQYNFEMVWLEPLIKEIVDMFAMTAKNKNLSLTLKLPEQMLPKMTIDPNKIKEVVSNLIDNALKYTKEGEITVSVEAKEASARIIVADTGMGISRDDKAKLFEKFIRSKETASMFVSGSGLGLYIGKSFVQAHGGKIWAESEGMGKGSRFIVELPFLNPNLKIGISEQSSMLGRGK